MKMWWETLQQYIDCSESEYNSSLGSAVHLPSTTAAQYRTANSVAAEVEETAIAFFYWLCVGAGNSIQYQTSGFKPVGYSRLWFAKGF